MHFVNESKLQDIQDVSKDLFKRRDTAPETTDMKFYTSGNKIVSAHQIILGLRSKYMEDLLKDMQSESVTVLCPDIPENVLSTVIRLLYLGNCLVSRDIVNDVIATLSMFGVNPEGLVTKTEDFSHSENFDNLHFPLKEKKVSPELRIAKTELNEEFIPEDDYIEDDIASDTLDEDYNPVTLSIKKKKVVPKHTNTEIELDWRTGEFNNHENEVKKYYAGLEGKLDLKSDEEVRRALENLAADTKRGPKPKPKGPQVCEICSKEYKRRAQHMSRNHPETLAVKSCEFCIFSTNKPYLMKEHILNEHKDKCHYCNYCSEYFASSIELSNHKTKVHNKGYYECDLCNTIFKQLIPFQEHQSDIHNKKVKCETCGFEARSNIHLNFHKKKHHKNPRSFVCNICSSTFNFEYELVAHNKISHEKVRIKCELCDHPGFISKTFVKEHILEVHAGVKFPCDKCGKSFGRKIYLTYHQKHSKKCKSGKKGGAKKKPKKRKKSEFMDYD